MRHDSAFTNTNTHTQEAVAHPVVPACDMIRTSRTHTHTLTLTHSPTHTHSMNYTHNHLTPTPTPTPTRTPTHAHRVPEAAGLCGQVVAEEGYHPQRVEHGRSPPPQRQRDELRRLAGLYVHHACRRDGEVLRLDLLAPHHREVVRTKIQPRWSWRRVCPIQEHHLDLWHASLSEPQQAAG